MARRVTIDGPHAVDLHVGAAVRKRRKALRMSLMALAAKIGLTHQQMQKYESGRNRIGASKLYEIAQALKTKVAVFYEGVETDIDEDPAEIDDDENAKARPSKAEEAELTRAFRNVQSAHVRGLILDLVKGLGCKDVAGG